jgi:hypothetical protein
LFNLLSDCFCLFGFYIGVSVSADSEVGKWIFSVTAGMFLYIALVDLVYFEFQKHMRINES